MDKAPTIYTTSWCGYCIRLKRQLAEHDVDFREVDIEHDPDAAGTVARLNAGNQTVPTVVFSDGTALTNPSLRQVKQQISSRARPPDTR